VAQTTEGIMMAGSLEMMQHDIKNCESFMDKYCLIENMGDAWEACEEAINRIENLEAAIKHIHWSMGVKSIHSDKARDNICPICDEALKGKDNA